MAKLSPIDELVSLKGQSALITGGGGGIGRAIALRVAEAGANLRLVDVNRRHLLDTQKALREFGTEIEIHEVDLADRKAIEDLWVEIRNEAPDILINNAGVFPFRPFLEIDESFYRHVLSTNLDSAFWMCQHMISKRGNRGGVIVNIGSIDAEMPFTNGLVHCGVSKAGVVTLTRVLARQFGRKGFRINAVLPGGISTGGTRKAARLVFRGQFEVNKTGLSFLQQVPVGRVGQPDEVACIILTLAGGLARYVHGAVIPVDGGFLSNLHS